jgi:hypothetical protein
MSSPTEGDMDQKVLGTLGPRERFLADRRGIARESKTQERAIGDGSPSQVRVGAGQSCHDPCRPDQDLRGQVARLRARHERCESVAGEFTM